jgi:hypothetical protein
MASAVTPYYVASRSRTRHYGYTVRDINNATSYFMGPGCTGGWYKLKRDAQHAADVMNAAQRDA